MDGFWRQIVLVGHHFGGKKADADPKDAAKQRALSAELNKQR